MGQGCSSALGVYDTQDRFADPPDRVMQEIVHTSVATVKYLRQRALRERFGEGIQKDVCRESTSNGQDHLLFHNLLTQEKQGHCVARDIPSPTSSSHKRRGRKIAESFEADRPKDAANLVEEMPSPKEHKSRISEAALEDFEFAISKTIGKKCPTRLWIRKRDHRRIKKNKRSSDEEDPPEESPQVLLLEQDACYLRNEDYFGTNVNEQAPTENKSKPKTTSSSSSSQPSDPHTDTHIYAVRYSENDGSGSVGIAEIQRETSRSIHRNETRTESPPYPAMDINNSQQEDASCGIYSTANMALPPKRDVVGWTTVSEKHDIYVVDLGLTSKSCNDIVTTTEQACRGRYAAYTYAKQTLGCREYPFLAQAALGPVHSMVGAILQRFDGMGPDAKEKAKKNQAILKECYQQALQLDDREPHIVKYDTSKKERQKLDMHTDKSEWTFLIALSNGCGLDYDGGGTYFECLDATVHIQKGHALVFPGKLRHKGQAISNGLRFLLVGFLVEKSGETATAVATATSASSKTTAHSVVSKTVTDSSSSTVATPVNASYSDGKFPPAPNVPTVAAA
eukprot:CAMPEP_0116100214 /NCGR_PEP_ID=MMETSP0327-20121206/12175_1 /TAXON_ID=44447 /ORGANISM="Pseudo-nitzschia delicatissima, Strain B596" /LENGTH=565 /DNA_ID=CAMNT_0003592129 /DNA_START=373 /DNA_END=2071 /DNA_ORIENTATION=+